MVGVCALSVHVDMLIGVWMMSVRVFLFNLADFVGLLLIVCGFDLAVRVEVFVFALAVRAFLACVRQIVVCQISSCLRVRLRLLSHADDLVDPAPEAADAGVERRGGRVSAAVTPGDEPGEDPSTRLALTQQPASGVALATVAMEEAGVWRTASAQCAVAGEAVAIALLTLPGRHQRDPGRKNGVWRRRRRKIKEKQLVH